jgi:hypothetical protein
VINLKTILNISKTIIILFFLFFIGYIIIAINPNYNNYRICRSNQEIAIENYVTINEVEEIELMSNCDKIRLLVKVNDKIDNENINAIILKFTSLKKQYNDDEFFEVIFKNDKINYIVTIDKEEKIDIDYSK